MITLDKLKDKTPVKPTTQIVKNALPITLDELNKSKYNTIPDIKGLGRIGVESKIHKEYGQEEYESFIKHGVTMHEGGDWEEARAQNQSVADQWGNAALKMGSLAATTFAETFTEIFVGLPTALTEGRFSGIYDNALSDELKEWNSNMEKWFPNYYTKERLDNPFYKNLFTANFWADKVLKNFGFVLGAIAGGVVTAGIGDALLGLKEAGAVAQLANDVSKLGTAAAKERTILEYGLQGINTVQDLHDVAKAIKFKQGLNKAISMYTAAQTEAGIEAHQGIDDFIKTETDAFVSENGRYPNANELEAIKTNAASAGNTRFAINLPLLMLSEGLQFSKAFSRGYGLDKVKLNSIVTEGGEALGSVAKKDLLNTTLKATSTPMLETIWDISKRGLEEGVYEEMGQYAIERGVADYYSHKLRGTADTNQMINSIATGLKESYGTAAGWEQGVIGAITGLMGMPGQHIDSNGKAKLRMEGGVWEGLRESKEKEQNTKIAVDFLNKQTPDFVKKFGALYENAANHNSYSKQYNKAIEDGDHFIAENAKFDDFISLVGASINTGTFDLLKDRINGVKDLDVDEFKRTFGIPQDTKVDASTINSHVASLVNTMDEVKKVKEDLDTRFALAPADFPLDDIKTIYLHNAIGIKNADKRIDELSTQYNKIMDKHKISIDMIDDKEDANIKSASETIDKLVLNDKRTEEEEKEFKAAKKKLELNDKDIEDLKQVKQNYNAIKNLDSKEFLDKVNEQYKDLQKIRKFSAIDHNKLLSIVNDLIRLREKRFNTIALHNYLDKNITSPKLEQLLSDITIAVQNRTKEAIKDKEKAINKEVNDKLREELKSKMNESSDFDALEKEYPTLKQDIRKYKKEVESKRNAIEKEFINKIFSAKTVEELNELSKQELGTKYADKINTRREQLTKPSDNTLEELGKKVIANKKPNEKAQVEYFLNDSIDIDSKLNRVSKLELDKFSDEFRDFIAKWREGISAKTDEGASSFSPTGSINDNLIEPFVTDEEPKQFDEKEVIAGINAYVSPTHSANIEEFDIIKTDTGIKIANSELANAFKTILNNKLNVGSVLTVKIDDEYIDAEGENKDKELNLKVVDKDDNIIVHLNRLRYLENELLLSNELIKAVDNTDEDKFKLFRDELDKLNKSDINTLDGIAEFERFITKWFGANSLLLLKDKSSTLSDFNIKGIIDKLFKRINYTTSQKLFDTRNNLAVWKQIIEQDLTGTKRLRNEVAERLNKGEERSKIGIETKIVRKTNGSILTTNKYNKVSKTVGEYGKDYRLGIIPSYSSKSDLRDLRDVESEKSFEGLSIVSDLNPSRVYMVLTNTPTGIPSFIPLQARTINDKELNQVVGYVNDIVDLINKNKDNTQFNRSNKVLNDLIDELDKIIYVNKDTQSDNKQFKINTSKDKVNNIHAIEFTVNDKRYDIIISAKGNVGINSVVEGKSTMLTKPNTSQLDNTLLSSLLKDKFYHINLDNTKSFNNATKKQEYDAKKATAYFKSLIDNGDLLTNVGELTDEKGNRISNFITEGKRNMIISIGDEIKDNFEETVKITPIVSTIKNISDKFPEKIQSFTYDCGACAMQQILEFVGIKKSEKELIKELNTNDKVGTTIPNIIKVANDNGLLTIAQKTNIDSLINELQKGNISILPIQYDKENQNRDFSNVWNEGHYVVLIGVINNKLVFEDPADVKRFVITKEDLLNRWHDKAVDGTIYDNYAVTFNLPVGEKEDMSTSKSSSVLDNALDEIQQKGKTLLQKELTIEQNKKVSENVLKIVADKLSARTNIPYYIVNYEDVKDKYENVESTTKGFYAPDERAVYFIRGNFTLETAFHEFAHPIVDRILHRNNKLYNELKNELVSDAYIDTFKEIIKTYTLEDYTFDTKVTQEELNNYNDDELFKFFEGLPKDVRIGLLSEGITNAWGQESEKWIDKKTGKVNLKLAENSSLGRLWKMIVEWFKDFIKSSKVEDIKPTTTIRQLGQMLALGDNDIQIEDIDRDAIKYTLKSIDILNSDKAKQIFEKGNKNNWSIDKILQELAIPKEQKELVKQSYLDGNKTPEDIAIDIAGKYSFVVKSEVAKDKKSGDFVISDDLGYPNEFGDSRYHEIGRPTQYYSNLTVPGGINYTENRIITPNITPSIKGHAQFAEDNDIGWFRSDEQVIGKRGDIVSEEDDDGGISFIKNPELKSEGVTTKTRRILEVQSDLFQKGRDKEDLIKNEEKEDWQQSLNFIELSFELSQGSISESDYYKQKEELLSNKPKDYISNENQFLQLLNKDNNWVTFFIKSIIQDSAKKGYKKVLFPRGETAAKIEGHDTITDEIRKIDNEINRLKFKIKSNVVYKKDAEYEIERLEKQKINIKSQGIEKLKPIEALYEIRITNILKKLGNINEVIDEYGNSWNEVTITPAHRNTILLQKGTNVFTSKETQSAVNLLASLVEEVNDKLDYWTLADINKKKLENKNNETLFELKANVTSRLIKIAKEYNTKQQLSDKQLNLILKIKDDLLYNDSDNSLWNKTKDYAAQVHKRIINELDDNTVGEVSVANTRLHDDSKRNQISTTSNLMDKVKRLFATLPQLKKEGNDYVEVRDELTGLFKPIDFTIYINYFKSLIPSATTKEEALDIVKSKIDYYPSLVNLVIKLEENKDGLLEAFYSTFKQANPKTIWQDVNLDNEGKIKAKLDYSNNNSTYRISNEWKENIKSRLTKEWINSNKSTIDDKYNTIKNNKTDINKAIVDIVSLFKLIGINFTDDIIKLEVSKDGNDFESLRKLFIVPLQNIIALDIKDFNENVIVEELKSSGRITDLAKIAGTYYFDKVENSKLNVSGNNTYDITTPNYMSDWFAEIKSNNAEARDRFLNYLKQLAKVPEMRYSNWLWNDTTSGLLNGDKNDIDNATLNDEYLNTFDYEILDGLKNTASREGQTYSEIGNEDYKLTGLNNYLFNIGKEDKNIIRTMSLALSDSSQGYWFVTKKIELESNIDIEDSKSLRNSKLYKAVENTVWQEVVRMKQAKDLLFERNEDGTFKFVDNHYVVKQDLPSLQLHYHKDKDGRVLNADGKAVGKVFQFHNIPALNLLNVFHDGVLNEINNNDTETIELFRTTIDKYIKDTVDARLNEYKDLQSIFAGKYDFIGDSTKNNHFRQLMLEYSLNQYISNVEQRNFWFGTLAEYANEADSNKRAKQISSPGLIAAWDKNNTFNLSVINDIKLQSNLYNTLLDKFTSDYGEDVAKESLKDYKSINIGDGQGYMTVQRAGKLLERYGKLSEYKDIIYKGKNGKFKIKDNVPITELRKMLQVFKGFYYDRYYNKDLNRFVSEQVKYSSVILTKSLCGDTDLAKLAKYMEDNDIDETVFFSAEKVGTTSLNKINSGNTIDDVLLKGLQYKQLNANNWRLQQEQPDEEKDAIIKAGVQISKLIHSNINKDANYKVGNETIKGKDLILHYQKLIIGDIRENLNNLLDKLNATQNEDGTFNIPSDTNVQDVLLQEAKDRGFSDNDIKSIQLVDGKFALPIFMNTYVDKWMSVLTSLFTNGVTNNKLPGFHHVLVSNAFRGSESLKCNIVDGHVVEFECKLPRWSKDFYREGVAIPFEDISDELKTLIGYRIPYSGKHSSIIIKVIGFTDDADGNVILLPNDVVARLGCDFDIDSLFGHVYHHFTNENGKIVKVNYKNKLSYSEYRNNVIRANARLLYNKLGASYKEALTDLRLERINNKLDKFSTQTTEELNKWLDLINDKLFPEEDKINAEVNDILVKADRLVSEEEYSKLDTEYKNSKQARQNRLLDVMKSILGSEHHLLESVRPAAYVESFDLATEINNTLTKKNNFGANDLGTQLEFRKHALGGKQLIPLGANTNTGLAVFQAVEAKLSDELAIEIPYKTNEVNVSELERKYGKDSIVKEDDLIILKSKQLGWNLDGTFTGVDNKLYSEKMGQLVDHPADAVKKPVPFNLNDYTFSPVSAIIATTGDMAYAYYAIHQPIVLDITDRYFDNQGILSVKKRDEVEYIKSKYYAKLYFKLVDAGKLKLEPKFVEQYNQYEGRIFLKPTEVKELFGYDINKPKRFTLQDLKNNVNKYSKGDTESVEYLKDQLQFTEWFNKFKDSGYAISDTIQLLSFDKVGASPNLNFTQNYLDRLTKSFKVNEDGTKLSRILVNDEPITESVYPKYFGVDKESSYPLLQEYLYNSNIASKELLKHFVLDFHSQVIRIRNKVLDNYTYKSADEKQQISNKLNKYITKSLIGRNREFQINEEEERRILGIDTTVNLDKNVDWSTYLTLSTLNKLLLLKDKLDIKENDVHILNYLTGSLSPAEKERNGFHFINFVNTRKEYNLDNQLVESVNNMYNSGDKFQQNLVDDLIKYNYITFGLSFNNNSYAKVIPVDILNNEVYQLGKRLYDVYDLMSNNDTFILSDDIVESFVTNNKNLLPIAKPEFKTIKDKDGKDKRVFKENQPIWEHDAINTDFIIVKNDLLERTQFEKATYIQVRKEVAEKKYEYPIYKRIIVNNESLYYPINSSGNWNYMEDKRNRSLIEKNNTKYNEQYYLDKLDEYINKNKKTDVTTQEQKSSRLPKLNSEHEQQQLKHLSSAFKSIGVDTKVVADYNIDGIAKIANEDGTITITYNPLKAREDSLWHEYGHLLIDLIGEEDDFIKQGFEQVKDSQLYKDVKKLYPELNDLQLNKEVLTTAVGIKASELFGNPEKLRQWNFWLNRLFRKIADWLYKLTNGRIGKNEDVAMKLAAKLLTGNLNVRIKGKLSLYEQWQKDEDDTKQYDDVIDYISKQRNYLGSYIKEFGDRTAKEKFTDLTKAAQDKITNLLSDAINNKNENDAYLALLQTNKYNLHMLMQLEKRLDTYRDDYLHTKLSEVPYLKQREFVETLHSADLFLASFKQIDNLKYIDKPSDLTETGEKINSLIKRMKNYAGRISNLQKVYDELTPKFADMILATSTDPTTVHTSKEIFSGMKDISWKALYFDALYDSNNIWGSLFNKYTRLHLDNARLESRDISEQFYNKVNTFLGNNTDKEHRINMFKKIIDTESGKLVDKYDLDKFYNARDAFFQTLPSIVDKKFNETTTVDDEGNLIAHLPEYVNKKGKTVAARDVVVDEQQYRDKLARLEKHQWYKDNTEVSLNNEQTIQLINEKRNELNRAEFTNWYKENIIEKGTKRYTKLGGEYSYPSSEYLNDKYRTMDEGTKEFYNYFKELVTELVRHYGGTIIGKGYIPAESLEEIEDKEGNVDERAFDTLGMEIHKIPFDFITMINQKPLIKIPKQADDESYDMYVVRALETISNEGRGEFDSLEEVAAENDKIKAENKKNHAEALNYDLYSVMPRFIEAATRHKYIQEIEADIKLALQIARRANYIKKNGSFETIFDKNKKNIITGEKEEATFTGETSRLYERMVKNVEMTIYDKFLEPSKYNNVARILKSYNAIKSIAFNPFSAFKNVSVGMIQNAIEHAGGIYIDGKSIKNGNKLYWGAVWSYISDMNKEDETSTTLANALIKYFDILFTHDELENKSKGVSITKRMSRLIFRDLGFFMQHSGEHMMQNQMLFAMLYSHKLVNGKLMTKKDYIARNSKQTTASMTKEQADLVYSHNAEVKKSAEELFNAAPSAIDLFELDNGRAKLKAEYKDKVNNNVINEFKQRVIGVNHEAQGIYNPQDKGTIENKHWGQMLMQFRHWMIPGWNRRFASTKNAYWNERRQAMQVGDYTSFWKLITIPFNKENRDKWKEEHASALDIAGEIAKGYTKYLTNAKLYWNTLSEYEKAGVRKTMLEMNALLATCVLLMMLRGLGKDDDKKKHSKYLNFLIYELDAQRTELLTYTPFYGWINEGSKIMASPAAGFGTLQNAIKLTNDVFMYPFRSDEKNRLQAGSNKDRLKIAIDAKNLTPFWNQLERWYNLESNNKYYKLW